MNRVVIFALVISLTASAIAQPQSPVRYNVTDLGTLEGFPSVCVWSINDNGQIVGRVTRWVNLEEISKAVLFDSTGKGNNIDLGTLGGLRNYALAINNSGQIVGAAADSNDPVLEWYPFHPTIFDPCGQTNNIKLSNNGRAWSINDHGQIVGDMANASGLGRAAIFDVNNPDNTTLLGTLAGFDNSVARSINNAGQIVGHAGNFPQPGERAMLFDTTGPGNDVDLGTLGGQYSAALSINDKGQIVGVASTDSGSEHAAIFDPNDSGNNVDLGTMPDCNYSLAVCINDKGQIVGWASVEKMAEPCYAVMFDPVGDGNNINLNDKIDPNLGWSLSGARGINENGWIVGNGTNPDGGYSAFLLTPVPANKADIAADGYIRFDDFALFAGSWQSSQGQPGFNPACDISEPNDGIINGKDLAVFTGYWLKGTP